MSKYKFLFLIGLVFIVSGILPLVFGKSIIIFWVIIGAFLEVIYFIIMKREKAENKEQIS